VAPLVRRPDRRSRRGRSRPPATERPRLADPSTSRDGSSSS
jgi:hypothetical protein